MRVWIVNPFDNLPGEGARRGRYEMMSRAFAAAGHRVVWWTSDFSHTRKCHREQTEVPADYEIRLIATPRYERNVSLARVRNHREFAIRWREAARKDPQKPEVVIVSSPPLKVGIEALKLRKSLGFKLVIDIQDAWPETFYRLLPNWLRFVGGIVFSPMHRAAGKLYLGADFVTGVCERYRELAQKYGAKDYAKFPLGIEFGDEACADRREEPIDVDAPRLVYVGNLGRGYDLMTVIEAMTLLDGSTLDIVGAGEGENEIGRYAAERGVADRVRFHGYLVRGEFDEVLSHCDIGIVPMRDDTCVGIPNKIADYAAHGLFTVSSLGGECEELLTRHAAGSRYEAGNARSLVEAILRATRPSASLLRSLDAAAIYRDYVRKISSVF